MFDSAQCPANPVVRTCLSLRTSRIPASLLPGPGHRAPRDEPMARACLCPFIRTHSWAPSCSGGSRCRCMRDRVCSSIRSATSTGSSTPRPSGMSRSGSSSTPTSTTTTCPGRSRQRAQPAHSWSSRPQRRPPTRVLPRSISRTSPVARSRSGRSTLPGTPRSTPATRCWSTVSPRRCSPGEASWLLPPDDPTCWARSAPGRCCNTSRCIGSPSSRSLWSCSPPTARGRSARRPARGATPRRSDRSARTNPLLAIPTVEEFVEQLLGSAMPIPAFYKFLGPTTTLGVTAMPDRDLPLLSVDDIADRPDGTRVVDVRTRAEQAAAIPGDRGRHRLRELGGLVGAA